MAVLKTDITHHDKQKIIDRGEIFDNYHSRRQY